MTLRGVAGAVLAVALCACAQTTHHLSAPGPIPAEERDVPSRSMAEAERTANRGYWDAHPDSDPAADAASGWVSHGPRNLAGVTYSLLFDPTDRNVLWSGSAEALWRSTDGGASWSVVPELEHVFVMCLARDSQNPNLMYAGTGLDVYAARGLFRSVDRGATWSVVPGSTGIGAIHSIATSPTSSGVLLAATSYGIYRSTDAGDSWTLCLSARVFHANVAFDPQNAANAISSHTDLSGGGSSFDFSTDGGVTWTEASGITTAGVYTTISAYAPSQPSRVYAVTAGGVYVASVWRSDDGGHTFVLVSQTPNVVAAGVLADLWVSPVDPSHFIFGCTTPYSSRNSGASLSSITLQQPAQGITYPHLDIHGIASDPAYDGTSNRRIYMWTDGGVFRSDNYEASSPTWTALLRGHESTQFYTLDVTASGGIVGGMQDTGVEVQAAGSDDCAHLFDGDITTVLFDPQNSSHYYCGSFGSLYRSDLSLMVPVVSVGDGAPRYFETPTALDPNSPSRLFVASGKVVRIEWSGTTPHVTQIRAADGVTVAAIAVQPGDSNVVWIANHEGAVFRTNNALSAAPTWTEVHRESTYYPTRILIDRNDPQTVYVSAINPPLIRTTDGGATWSDAKGTAPTALPSGVYDLAQHPTERSWLYAGTDNGLYATRDGGATWAIARRGIPGRTSVRALKFRPGTSILYVGTYGRGIWSIDVSAPGGKRHSARH